MRAVAWLVVTIVLAGACPGQARIVRQDFYGGLPVDYVPIERVLANLRETTRLSPAEKERATGRMYLLAHVRNSGLMPIRRGFGGEQPLAYGIADRALVPCASAEGASSKEGVCEPTPPFGAWRTGEIPAIAASAPRRSRYLAPAIAAYQRALVLEPDNPRSRLALAWLLDQNGRPKEALRHLRYAANLGLSAISVAPTARTTHLDRAAYFEVVEHLSLLARHPADKALAAELRRRLPAGEDIVVTATPILIPLTAETDLTDLINPASPVVFDYSGQGDAFAAGWITAEAAWLVWDPLDERQVTSGFQLFGSVTWVAFWDNGYRPLSLLDDNGDGRLAGNELAGLALWRDANGDGHSSATEVTPIAAAGVVSLGLTHRRLQDDAWIADAGVTFRNGRTAPTYDWIVSRKPAVP